ncbi:hypothetical protein J3R82DRAFT_5190 [Butyriboletus roseoflavus]|nr:hypothetical protein J3R82DRAFT_5190 [Butyriboletus roseoflavus]
MAQLKLPPELWLSIFHYATHVSGTLIPDIYAHASHFGSIYTKSSNIALRDALVTKRAIVRVCKQWWHLAVPHLYASVYVGRVRCLSSLSSTLMRSATGKGTVPSTRPLGEYTQRLDIAIRDHSENVDSEFESLAALITCMPHLAIVSFVITPNYYVGYRVDLPNNILDALHYSAASLRVLDWSSTRLEPSASRIMNLLAKCTQLRVLKCPRLVWSKDLQHGGIPLTVSTIHLHAIIPIQIATAYNNLLPCFDPNASRHPGPSALQELILDLNRDIYHWKDLLEVYSSQLVSVHFYVSTLYTSDVNGHLQLLAQVCPSLRRLTITSERFSSFIRPHLVFPSITYLGLRTTRAQSPKPDFETLFAFLEELRSSVPSLQVVQLVNEQNVQCLLRTHTKFAVRALQPFLEDAPFRIEDREGVLLTGSGSPLLGGHAWTDRWLDRVKWLGRL